MKKLLVNWGIVINLMLLSQAPALAATQEELLTTIFGQLQWYILIAFVLIIFIGVYFMKFQDRRQTPLNQIIERGEPIHSIGPNTLVTECVRLMTARKIGALLVMDNNNLVGIFTERDALNKVLAGGLDSSNTKVSEVMTRDPYCVHPTSTVDEAMKVMTMRRFRHLPIVKDGKVLAVVSSGDLTLWLGRYREEEFRDLVDLDGRP
jgi:CBS domain-containing protein